MAADKTPAAEVDIDGRDAKIEVVNDMRSATAVVGVARLGNALA